MVYQRMVVTLVYSYLKRRKQGVKMNDNESVFQIVLPRTSQGSVLGPILFISILFISLFFFNKDV